MEAKRTAMIIGAGRFGANYPRVLAEINTTEFGSGHPSHFHRLVITRTRASSARESAATFYDSVGRAFDHIEGIEVTDQKQLRDALDRLRPALICITARDARLGDAIHARYAPLSLNYGSVLCEKPFSEPSDNRALTILEDLTRQTPAECFGMHLPMAPVLTALLAHPTIGNKLRCAGRMEFIWEKMGESDDLIADLALHPWSLIPGHEELHVAGVMFMRSAAVIDFKTPHLTGRIRLGSGGSLRAMCLDGDVLRFEFDRGSLRVIAGEESWAQIVAGKRTFETGEELLTVPNPLKQHLRAVIQGRPMVDLSATLRSQRFLSQTSRFTT
jgi:hypothetical protein